MILLWLAVYIQHSPSIVIAIERYLTLLVLFHIYRSPPPSHDRHKLLPEPNARHSSPVFDKIVMFVSADNGEYSVFIRVHVVVVAAVDTTYTYWDCCDILMVPI